VFFPHDDNRIISTKSIIKDFDLFIADIFFASTGQGIELGWTDYCNKPILCIFRKGSKISSSLKLITNNFIEYSDNSDLAQKTEKFMIKNYSV